MANLLSMAPAGSHRLAGCNVSFSSDKPYNAAQSRECFSLHCSWQSADLKLTLLQVLPALAFGAIYLALSSPATTFGILKTVFGCEYTPCCLSTHRQDLPPFWLPG